MPLNRPRPLRAALLALAAVTAAPGAVLLLPAATSRPAEAFTPPNSFADLAAQLLPAVVNISSSGTATHTADSDNGDGGSGGGGGGGSGRQGPEVPSFPPGSPFEQFFHDFMERNRHGQRGGEGGQQQPERRMQSLGSGFIIDPSGIVVTNNHVIDGADEVTVTLQDNTSFKAKVLGKDERADMAVLQIKSDKPLPAVHFGDSDTARVGDWVVAIGNPFGLGGTVTAGIVSARGRDIHQGPYDDFIQTDAPINRGNSGGPLFDMDGNVIGVNSAIFSPSGGSVGIGFSIPSNMAREVVDQLRQFGQTKRGWLGVRIQQVTSDIAEGLGLPGTQGALVADVTANGPAARAGIENGDLILSFDGRPVADSRALPRIVADTAIGKAVNVDLWRKGKRETLRVTVAKLEDSDTPAPVKVSKAVAPPKPNSKLGQLGLTLGLLDDGTRNKYHVPSDVQGAVVTDVDPNSPAGEKNFRPGDVIVEVQSQAVHSPDDVTRHLESDSRAGRKVELLLVSRDGVATYVALRLAEG
jgi:serine protease Do